MNREHLPFVSVENKHTQTMLRHDGALWSRLLQMAVLVLGSMSLLIYTLFGSWASQMSDVAFTAQGPVAVDIIMSPLHSTVKIVAIRPTPGM
jgi:hypothetical protein